jgi:hypothetical protein
MLTGAKAEAGSAIGALEDDDDNDDTLLDNAIGCYQSEINPNCIVYSSDWQPRSQRQWSAMRRISKNGSWRRSN